MQTQKETDGREYKLHLELTEKASTQARDAKDSERKSLSIT